jgi:hypothetical protein
MLGWPIGRLPYPKETFMSKGRSCIAGILAFSLLALASPMTYAEEMKGEMQGEQTEAKMKVAKKARHVKQKGKSQMKDDAMGKEASPDAGKN